MEIKVEDKTYVVKKPSQKEVNLAKRFSNVKFREYVQGGLMLRDELDTVLQDRGYWSVYFIAGEIRKDKSEGIF